MGLMEWWRARPVYADHAAIYPDGTATWHKRDRSPVVHYEVVDLRRDKSIVGRLVGASLTLGLTLTNRNTTGHAVVTLETEAWTQVFKLRDTAQLTAFVTAAERAISRR